MFFVPSATDEAKFLVPLHTLCATLPVVSAVVFMALLPPAAIDPLVCCAFSPIFEATVLVPMNFYFYLFEE